MDSVMDVIYNNAFECFELVDEEQFTNKVAEEMEIVE
jgi:hypothetical protein